MLSNILFLLTWLALFAAVFGPVLLYRHWRSRRQPPGIPLICANCKRTLDRRTQEIIANGDAWCLVCLYARRPDDYQVIYDFARANPPIPDRPTGSPARRNSNHA